MFMSLSLSLSLSLLQYITKLFAKFGFSFFVQFCWLAKKKLWHSWQSEGKIAGNELPSWLDWICSKKPKLDLGPVQHANTDLSNTLPLSELDVVDLMPSTKQIRNEQKKICGCEKSVRRISVGFDEIIRAFCQRPKN